MRPTRLIRCCFGLLTVVVLLLLPAMASAGEEIHVVVVAILATDHDTNVDAKLECIAREVQNWQKAKQEQPLLTGFILEHMNCKPLRVGVVSDYTLVDKEVASVTVLEGPDRDKRVCLKVKAPLVGDIDYTTACGKYFPIVTRYQNADGKRLIVAIMVKPCQAKP